MAPKRKASSSKAPAAKKPAAAARASPSKASPATTAASPGSTKSKQLSKLTVNDVWEDAEYVQGGKLTQQGYGELCKRLSLGELSFEAIFFMFCLSPDVKDVMTVCASKAALQRAVESLGCRTLGELPGKLGGRRLALECDFGAAFQPFFGWLFDMGKALAALSTNHAAHSMRTVPQAEGLMLMAPVLAAWPLLPDFKAFCADKFKQPFTKDLWTQIGRLVHMTKVGTIVADLSNYDDDETGGGSAWPCAIDDFVEFVAAARMGD